MTFPGSQPYLIPHSSAAQAQPHISRLGPAQHAALCPGAQRGAMLADRNVNVSVQKGNAGGGRVREMTVWGRWRESKRVLTTQTDFGKL